MGISTQTARDSTLRIDMLLIFQAPTGSYHATGDQLESIAALTKQLGIASSVATSVWLDPFNVQMGNILGKVFERSLFEPGGFTWNNVHPEPDHFNFILGDIPVNYSKRVYMSPLVWGLELPSWLLEEEYSREELIGIMHNHIQTIMDRYRDRYPDKERFAWVVCEAVWAFDGYRGYEQNIWYRTIGPEYIKLAFNFAREADADAILVYNDYGNEVPGPKSEAVYDLISDLKEEGTPIDVIGMQFHLDAANPPNKEEIISNMRRFATLGVDVYVTELDVNLINLSGAKEEKLAIQAQIYKEVVEACVESEVCKHIILWGLSDRPGDAWIDRPGGAEAPAVFDENYSPKPAYFAILDALRAAASQP
jgi:endo-1,4-beta-xylanase